MFVILVLLVYLQPYSIWYNAWGAADKTLMQELNVKLNNIVRTITYSSKHCPVTSSYKTLNFLKLDNIYPLEVAKFMYQLQHRNLKLLSTTVSLISPKFTVTILEQKITWYISNLAFKRLLGKSLRRIEELNCVEKLSLM